MTTARRAAQEFRKAHTARTFHPDNPRLDPWLREVVMALQECLDAHAKQLDDTTRRLDRIEQILLRPR